jgi:hypothetical protein
MIADPEISVPGVMRLKPINACRNKSSVFVEVNFPFTFKSLVGGLFFNRITSYVRFLYPADGNHSKDHDFFSRVAISRPSSISLFI